MNANVCSFVTVQLSVQQLSCNFFCIQVKLSSCLVIARRIKQSGIRVNGLYPINEMISGFGTKIFNAFCWRKWVHLFPFFSLPWRRPRSVYLILLDHIDAGELRHHFYHLVLGILLPFGSGSALLGFLLAPMSWFCFVWLMRTRQDWTFTLSTEYVTNYPALNLHTSVGSPSGHF